MIDQKNMKVLAITFTAITILLILLVIVLPLLIKSKIKSNYIEQTTPHSDNTNLWAKFPGDVKTKMTHTFNILDYSQDNLKIKDSLTLEEEVFYDNFNFTDKEDKLIFDAKSTFKINTKPKNESINTISLGMFETFETLSNPTKYQKGINSIQYLLNKGFPKPDLFIRQMFTYDLYSSLIVDDERVLSTLLRNVDREKALKILSSEEQYSQYSFKKMTGFYKWIKILGLPEEIEKATWLSDIFGLTQNEIDSIIGKDNFLHTYYINYNIKLAYKFDCNSKTTCGNEILYLQLMSGEVLKSIGLDGMSSLYQMVDPEYYPFSKSPELNVFFEEYKKKINKFDIKFEDYAPNVDQLNTMIDLSSYTSLLSANNSALFLSLNETGNTYQAYEIYKISTNVLQFMSDYIYEYLPSLFLYQEFYDDKGEIHTIDPIAKAYATITQGVVENTYRVLSKTTGIYNLILSQLIWESLLNKILLFNKNNNNKNNLKQSEPDEICPLIMQRALDDGKKVLKVCSDPVTSFNSPYTIIKWFSPYYCVVSGDESKCDMSIINYLKTIIYITNDEIKAIYSKDFFGGIIEEKDKLLKEIYKCGEVECDNDYLAKIQFWKGEITKNLPEPLKKCNTISELFPEEFPYPLEISYYAEQIGETEPIPEEDIDYLISLSPKGDNILSEESSEALEAKTSLEKEYTLIIEGKIEKTDSKYKIIDLLNNGYLFNNEIKTNYLNINNILQGSIEEDKKYIKFLSSGKFFENYKPNLNQTTGFNFGMDLNNEKYKYIEYNRYGIYGKQTDTSHTMRKIVSINDFPILNIKKLEYNYLLNNYSYINSPIMNSQVLTGEKSFIDGLQYEFTEEAIYLYDTISSRPFKFNYIDDVDYNELTCKKYEIDKNDLSDSINELNDINSKKAFLTQKLNKPFMISVGKEGLNSQIDENISEENYICVEPFTNLVVDSKINFVYSLYTKKYGYINPKIENEKIYPIFIYQKNYEVDIDSFNENFPSISSFYTFKLVFLIVGIILIFVCAAVALWGYLKLHKTLIEEDIQKNIPGEKLIDSRDPTITNKSEN